MMVPEDGTTASSPHAVCPTSIPGPGASRRHAWDAGTDLLLPPSETPASQAPERPRGASWAWPWTLPASLTGVSPRVQRDPAGDGENCKQHVDCCPCCCGTGTRRWQAGDLNPEALDVPLRGLLQGSHIFLFYL
uniref:Uncharacterized protein n=1 Tax=Myotis myotis TaxID=51298 RepID=A0A7J7YDX5_MYOMY|nr:hypothetical protein mMyoMyo1_011101 [Myotis myotis]